MSNTPARSAAHPPGSQGNKFTLVQYALQRAKLDGGDPYAYVKRMREEGNSLGFIAGELSNLIRRTFGKPNLTISHETVRRWERGILPKDAESHANQVPAVTAVEPQRDEHGVPQATFQAPPETGGAGA